MLPVSLGSSAPRFNPRKLLVCRSLTLEMVIQWSRFIPHSLNRLLARALPPPGSDFTATWLVFLFASYCYWNTCSRSCSRLWLVEAQIAAIPGPLTTAGHFSLAFVRLLRLTDVFSHKKNLCCPSGLCLLPRCSSARLAASEPDGSFSERRRTVSYCSECEVAVIQLFLLLSRRVGAAASDLTSAAAAAACCESLMRSIGRKKRSFWKEKLRSS